MNYIKKTCAAMESLEERRMLTGVGGREAAWLAGGNLMVKGTRAADTVVISLYKYETTTTNQDGTTSTTTIDKIRVLFNDKEYKYHADQVRRISVNGRGGDDSIKVDETAGAVLKRMDLIGGGGHDTLVGGSGNDRLNGDWGNDSMDGGGGMDMLVGGVGDDSMMGGDGNDKMLGNAGNDTMDGGAGNDRVAGQAGDDDLSGGEGVDSVSGGSGNDDFVGGTADAETEVKDEHEEDDGENVMKVRKKKVLE